ncbi:MAG: asparagine synthase-related protein [Thermoguttaceae bacterium]
MPIVSAGRGRVPAGPDWPFCPGHGSAIRQDHPRCPPSWAAAALRFLRLQRSTQAAGDRHSRGVWTDQRLFSPTDYRTARKAVAGRPRRADVLDLAARIPHRWKHPGRNRGKLLLRKMLRQYLPEEIVGRSKSGFGIPLDTSLGVEKRQAIESMLTRREARIRPLIDEGYTKTISRAFVTGQRPELQWSRYGIYQNVYMLWSLERWLQKWDPAT